MKPAVAAFGAGDVRLRLLSDTDLETTLAWRNREEARRWFKASEVVSLTQHRSWFDRYQTADDDLTFVVEVAGLPVGQVAVYGIDRTRNTAEVGRFLVAPEAAGKGYLFAACRELVDFCEKKLSLHSIYLEVFQDNQRAIRLYEGLGFLRKYVRDKLVFMEKIFPK